MKQKVAFINAFPSDTFSRGFNFADYFYTFWGNNFCDLSRSLFFSFQSAVYFAILKIRTHYSCTYKFPKGRTCKKKST